MQIRHVLKNANKGMNLRGITFTPHTTQKKMRYQKLNAVAASSAVKSQEVRRPGLTPHRFHAARIHPGNNLSVAQEYEDFGDLGYFGDFGR